MNEVPRESLVFGSLRDVETTRQEVEVRVHVSFEAHNSDYLGGDYCRSVSAQGEEVWIIQPNVDGEERRVDEWHGPTVLLVETTRRGDEVRALLAETSLTLVSAACW
jgi:hypothetical protein